MKLAIAAACLLIAAPLQTQAQIQYSPLPPGHGYAPGEWTPHPLDPCARDGMAGGLASLINAQVHLPGQVVRIDQIKSPDPGTNADTTQPYVTCHGLLIFADGRSEPGTVVSHDPGGDAPVQVTWEPDCWGLPYYLYKSHCPATNPALARNGHAPQWTRISHSDTYAAYIDPGSRRRGTNTPDHSATFEMPDLVDFNSPQSWDAGPVLSVMSWVRFDCADWQLMTLDHTSFSAHMGRGDIVEQGAADDRWHPPAPGTMDDFLLNRACPPSSTVSR